MSASRRGGFAVLGVLLLVLVVIGGLALAGINPLASLMGGTSDKTSDLAADIPAAQQTLSVNPDEVPTDFCDKLLKERGAKFYEDDDVKTPRFIAGALKNVGDAANQRRWSDAVNVPLSSPQSLEEEQAVICHDVPQAAMVMNGMQKVKIGDKTVAELNPWMKAQGTPRAIARWSTDCMQEDIDVHLECAKVMANTAYLLGKFQDDGVRQGTTEWNYHLAGPTVGGLPEFRMNPEQYKGYFLVMSYTTKDGALCVPLGFNVGVRHPDGGDQRFALLECGQPPGQTPECVSDCGPTGTPCVRGCDTPTTPPTNPPTCTTQPCGPTTPTPTCTHGCNPTNPPTTTPPTNPPTPPPTKCPCVSTTDATQTPNPPPTNNVPSNPPSAQPTHPVNTASPPAPTQGGYNGGSTSQPGTTAPPSNIPEMPTDAPTQTSDPGGF